MSDPFATGCIPHQDCRHAAWLDVQDDEFRVAVLEIVQEGFVVGRIGARDRAEHDLLGYRHAKLQLSRLCGYDAPRERADRERFEKALQYVSDRLGV